MNQNLCTRSRNCFLARKPSRAPLVRSTASAATSTGPRPRRTHPHDGLRRLERAVHCAGADAADTAATKAKMEANALTDRILEQC